MLGCFQFGFHQQQSFIRQNYPHKICNGYNSEDHREQIPTGPLVFESFGQSYTTRELFSKFDGNEQHNFARKAELGVLQPLLEIRLVKVSGSQLHF